jgi:hypothetical protein
MQIHIEATTVARISIGPTQRLCSLTVDRGEPKDDLVQPFRGERADSSEQTEDENREQNGLQRGTVLVSLWDWKLSCDLRCEGSLALIQCMHNSRGEDHL